MSDQAATIRDLEARLAGCEAEAVRTQKIQSALYRVADAASAASDMHEFYSALHLIVAELMYAANFFIATLNEETDILSWPYHVDEKDEGIWWPRPRKEFHGLTDYVMRKGRSVHTLSDYPSITGSNNLDLVGTLPEDGIFVPLRLGSRVLGALAVQSYTPGLTYTEDDVHVLTFVAQHIATALTRAQAIDETRRRNSELAILNSVGEAMAKSLDVKTVTRLVGDKVRGIFDADAVSIDLLDATGRMFHSVFQYDEGEGGYIDYIEPYPLGTGLNSTIVRTRQPLRLGTVKAQIEAGAHIPPEVVERGEGIITQSWLGVPIIVGDRVLGAVNVSDYAPNLFVEEDVRLLQTLAANMGVAIENARLFEAERKRAAELAAINTVSQALVAEADLDRLIQLIGDQLLAIFKPDIAFVALVDEQARQINFPFKYGDEFPQMRLGQGLTSRIIESGSPLLINRDIANRAAEMGTERVGKLAVSFLGVPILAGGKAIGVISVQSTREEDVFNEDDRRLLSTIAANAGAAIRTARLHAETLHRAREMATLAEVGREISSSLDREVVLERIAQRAEQLLAAQTSAVFLMDKDGRSMRAIAAVGRMADQIKSDRIELGQGIVGALAQEARAEFVNDMTRDPRALPIPGTEEISIERLMAAPLLKGDEVVGMLAVWRASEPFCEADLNFLTGLARQAAIALENARLFAEIEAEKQFSEALVENSPVAIMSIDDRSRVVAWNPGAEKLFGYSVQEAVGRNIDDLIANSGEIRAEAAAYSQQAARAEPVHAITRRTRKDGSFVDVELSGVPVTREGRRAGFIGLYHDITELQRARKEAVAANEAKSAFLATMSHEIRTPMNAVIGMSGLLMDTPLTPEQREYAETIRDSGDALLAIINDILDFSKIEAGKMELESQPFDLRECVESALDLVAARGFEKDLDLAYLIDEDVPTGIRGDVTRLRQILLNLIGNALKFTEKGEVVLTIKRDQQPDHLQFAVRDSGIGIAADRISRLFESFTQADSSTTRRYGGSGLGLAISRRLTELMGGVMWAESPGLGMGSTFSFTIAFESVALPSRRPAQAQIGIQPWLKGKRMLIVDDNETNRRILTIQARKWGLAPRATASATEALKWLRSNLAFDLAILDEQMPEMDGIALARELRKIERWKSLPLIFLTSLGRREIRARDLGFALYLTKPLKPSALFDALAEVFARATGTARAQPVRTPVELGMAERHPLRILVAEDNAVNQKLALRLLQQMGYRADVASNGLEAVECVQRQAYDLVLMDVQMPELDGLGATRTIRGLKSIHQPRIVAMTANAMQGDRETCLEAGMDDYLSKPIRMHELAGSLEAAGTLPSPLTGAPGGAVHSDTPDRRRPRSKVGPSRRRLTKAANSLHRSRRK